MWSTSILLLIYTHCTESICIIFGPSPGLIIPQSANILLVKILHKSTRCICWGNISKQDGWHGRDGEWDICRGVLVQLCGYGSEAHWGNSFCCGKFYCTGWCESYHWVSEDMCWDWGGAEFDGLLWWKAGMCGRWCCGYLGCWIQIGCIGQGEGLFGMSIWCQGFNQRSHRHRAKRVWRVGDESRIIVRNWRLLVCWAFGGFGDEVLYGVCLQKCAVSGAL